MFSDPHIPYMQRCLQLAELGKGRVATNPLVGAVLVHEGRIIGEGWHKAFGGPHAEVNCFDSVQQEDKSLIKDSILYVSLEPCAHYGKTPPCTLRIISEGVKRVVIGMKDPFEKVNGLGTAHLQQAGIEVVTGVLEKECTYINRRFVTYHQKKRPFVHLKWAQTADGYVGSEMGKPRLMITNQMTARQVHQWRVEEGAVLVGTRTAEEDNPLLDTRYWLNEPLKRIIIDKSLQLSHTLKIFNASGEVLILNEIKEGREDNITYLKTDFSVNHSVVQILGVLYVNKIQSVLVEGGAETLHAFFREGLWDEAHVLTNTKLTVGEGLKAPEVNLGEPLEKYQINDDQIAYYLNG